MRRITVGMFALALLALAATQSQADIVASYVDFNGFTPSGLGRFDESTGVPLPAGDVPAGAAGGALFLPSDLATSPDGRIFAVDGATGTILQFDGATGAPAGLNGLFAFRGPSDGELNLISLTFGPNGNLYVLDAVDASGEGGNPGIRVYDPDTGMELDPLLLEDSTNMITLVDPSSIVFDNTGDILLSDRSGGKIFKVDVSEDTIETFIDSGPGIFGPAGMAVSDTGDIYVANLFGNNIVRYDSDGTNPNVFATISPNPPPTPPGSNFPSDLIFNRAGDELLVAVLGADNPGPDGTAAGQILSFDLNGNLTGTIADDLRPTSSITLTADLLPADFNGDGQVDTADYDVWRAAVGSTVTATTGADANGDGMVDLADYTIWRNTLGSTGGSVGTQLSTVGVPEPNSLVLASLVATAAVLLGYKRRGIA